MTEPAEHLHLDGPGSPSGEALEHLPASERAVPQNGDRGRQRAQQRAQNCVHVNTGKLWQMQEGGRRGVCPAPAAGNELSICPDELQETPDPRNYRKNGEDRGLQGLQGSLSREEVEVVDSDTGLDARIGRKRHRRRTSRKKRTWKPYNKLSWEEKKALEERETARASRMREEMFAKGLPVAPYNTTQFLMDEHDREEPDLNTESGARRSLGAEDPGSEEDLCEPEEEDEDDGSGGGGSDGIGRAGSAGGEFLQKDFSETYEMYHVESLQNMTKQELVQEYLELEKCMSRLEEENNRLRQMQQELERLRAENTELLQGQLRTRDMHSN
ncbi:protein HEXIM1 [Cololabis saira]|uniref:protein HEXIM1 n=1 Tax=Cololabis saira TaxID=129043 RepID=UPI002AD320E4|nr:protein HEXIM1 [Cololabis saira]